jgi:hypothetical protein
MLKDSVDHVDVIENAQHERAVLAAQPIEVPARRIIESERHSQEIMEVVRAALVEVESLPMEQAVRRLVVAAIEGHRIDPDLHRVLSEQIPRTGKLENVEVFNRQTHAMFRAYLERHADEFRAVDLEMAAFVCVTSIEALTHTAVLHHADFVTHKATRALIDEATRLVIRYLQ